MHASIWRFAGDPDDLLARYDAMLAELPASSMWLHVCLRAADGVVLVDTCPSKAAYDGFASSAWFAELRARHGLPEPTALEDFPVHVAIVDGRRIET